MWSGFCKRMPTAQAVLEFVKHPKRKEPEYTMRTNTFPIKPSGITRRPCKSALFAAPYGSQGYHQARPFLGAPAPSPWTQAEVQGAEMYHDAQRVAREALGDSPTATQVLQATASMQTIKTARDTLVAELVRRHAEYLDLALVEALERRGLVFAEALSRLTLNRAPEVDTLLLDGTPILRVTMRFKVDFDGLGSTVISKEHL